LLLALLAACNGVAESDTSPEDLPEDEIILSIGDLLVYVPAGPFTMGSAEDDPLAREDEFPAHTVRLSGYYIYRNEVTNAQYKACVEAGDCTEPADLGEGPST
jgi:formylglycine-generating enzyme required for sulfatase activity